MKNKDKICESHHSQVGIRMYYIQKLSKTEYLLHKVEVFSFNKAFRVVKKPFVSICVPVSGRLSVRVFKMKKEMDDDEIIGAAGSEADADRKREEKLEKEPYKFRAEGTAFSFLDSEDEGRGMWSSPVEFVMCGLGTTIGLGNVWRFPYLIYKYGGGSFIIVYWILFFLVGYPCFFLELCLGQFTTQAPTSLFQKMLPLFEGLGWAIFVAGAISACCYNAVYSWTIFYLFSTFHLTPSWSQCPDDVSVSEN